MSRLLAGRRPTSSYRWQFNSAFTFRDAARLVPYLHDLGVTDCYASPYLQARPGSPHCYDVCDPGVINPELGAAEEFESFVLALKERDMGLLLDVVPNHMSSWATGNRLWRDVLENGPSSPYARFFDVDWHPLRSDTLLEDRVLLPILGDSYGTVLERQELQLFFEDGAFQLRYYENLLPLDPSSYIEILRLCEERLSDSMDVGEDYLRELQSIITAISHLPSRTERDPERVQERQREKEVVKRRLNALCEASAQVRAAVNEAVGLFNGISGDPSSFDRLDALLEQQPYRLAHWQVAAEEINYRRFFDVSDLVALRQEDPEVFDETHRLILKLLGEGIVTGLRIDHVDGLWDPAAYLSRLQRSYLEELGSARDADEDSGRPLYLVVEKILRPGEKLPPDWPVDGTTGYDFANAVNGIFVDNSNARSFDVLYRRFIGFDMDFQEQLIAAKKRVMLTSLASEVNMLAYQLRRIAARNRNYRDLTLNGLTFGLRETIACLPVYRTYISRGDRELRERDRTYLEGALAEARRRNPSAPAAVFDFVSEILLLRWPAGAKDEDRGQLWDFVRDFQQVTGPTMAKAMEDTVFYVYNRLISLNEVGGDPGRFGISVDDFHQQNALRLQEWPYSLTSTTTHDTKRSEGVRARINLLSEMPREWKAMLGRWSKSNGRRKRTVSGRPVPDRNEEYYLYQTLLGSWPVGGMDGEQYRSYQERVEAHMIKAIREAKVNTSWVNPNSQYEDAVRHFVGSILNQQGANPFLKSFHPFRLSIARYGMINSLSQTLLKIASPGGPDFYQGTELWDLHLVDPDNRRPVEYGPRVEMLERIKEGRETGERLSDLAAELLAHWEDGGVKLHLIHRALSYRRRHPDTFTRGDYVPLAATGRHRDRVCAFARRDEDATVVVVVPRLVWGLMQGKADKPGVDGGEQWLPLGDGVWEDTRLLLPSDWAAGGFRNLLTGEKLEPVETRGRERSCPDCGHTLQVGSILATFPVALLELR
ncbi:MAG TPA: malto-oligosyltrehalose synthase [Chloroflexota bacterium]|nr:malto-oligosyltrehalose synthase [Chloroflexota bacterium]